jgi:putative two-component system response regulator
MTTVLVVDDCAVNREVIHEILDGDYELVDAANGQEACQRAERHRPQVVLLDVMLPDADGYTLCRRLRSHEATSRARIIMVTAKALPQEQAAGFQAGADAYLTKPFHEEELRAVIDGA